MQRTYSRLFRDAFEKLLFLPEVGAALKLHLSILSPSPLFPANPADARPEESTAQSPSPSSRLTACLRRSAHVFVLNTEIQFLRKVERFLLFVHIGVSFFVCLVYSRSSVIRERSPSSYQLIALSHTTYIL